MTAAPPPPADLSRLAGVPLDDERAPVFSAPQPTADLSRLADIPLDDEGAPVFAAPWEASAFALAVRLSAAGCFTWDEWAAALAEEVRAAQREGDPDLGDTYYRHWVRALERLCAERGVVSPGEAERRKEAWRDAYLRTPHGQPVAL